MKPVADGQPDAGNAKARSHAQHARGDIRNLLRVALALSKLEQPTLNNLARETGHVKAGILRDLKRLEEQLGLVITKRGSCYVLESWGPVLKNGDGISDFLSMAVKG